MKLTHFPQVINGKTFQYEAVVYLGEYVSKKLMTDGYIEYAMKDGSDALACAYYTLNKPAGFKVLVGSPDDTFLPETLAEFDEDVIVYSNCDQFCSDQYIVFDEEGSKRLYSVGDEPAPYDPNNEDDQEPMEIEDDHGADIILVHM